MKKKIWILIIVLIILTITASIKVNSYIKSEEYYLVKVFKNTPYRLNAKEARDILAMQQYGVKELKSLTSTTTFYLMLINKKETNHRINKLMEPHSSFSSYQINGQYVKLNDEEHNLLSEWKLRNRLFEKDEEYTFNYSVTKNGKSEHIEVRFIKNLLGEYNKPTYYCNPLYGDFT